MRTLTVGQWQAVRDVQQTLVERGWHPSIAGRLVRRAVDHIGSSDLGCNGLTCCGRCSDGLGRIQMRSLRRDLDPTIKPRPIMSGEQCIRIQETPGSETAVYQQLDEYRSRGWNVMEYSRTKGFPSVAVYWACPPGQQPRESQGDSYASHPYGVPLYVKESF